MIRNIFVKLVVGFAIFWQLFHLVHYNDLFVARNNKEQLILQDQVEPHDSPLKTGFGRNNDALSKTFNSTNDLKLDGSQSKQNTDHHRHPKIEEKSNSTNTTKTISISNFHNGRKPVVEEMATKLHSNSSLNATTLSSIRNECFAFNSNQWINGSIHSNNDDGITPDILETLLEGPRNFQKLNSVFDQTICHADSPIRNFSPQRAGGLKGLSHLASVEDWYHRFLYLALHWKFHQPALNEHRSRKKCAVRDAKTEESLLQSFMDHHQIKQMDFECRDAKFLVIPIGSIGFGAFLNTQASLSILLALQTNRIPIFSSKSFFPWQKRKGDRDPWLLAPTHCDRKDFQCYFLTMSPCTVTYEDLDAAPIYGSNREEQQFLGKKLTIPPELESERIVVVNSGLVHKPIDTEDMRKIASTAIKELLDEWRKSLTEGGLSWSVEDFEDMDLAHRWIKEKNETDPIGLLRQVYVYMLRPNPYYKDLLEKQMSALVPQDIDPSDTIGIAIRGSDKCKTESMCLPFDRYMELATDVAYPYLRLSRNISFSSPPTTIRPKLIMTTEDPQLFNESLVYQRNDSFPFQFLVNNNDNMQGSGYPREFSSGDKEKTIISSLVALKLHFNAGRVYLNCCSNFHLVLNHLLQGQCGARRHGHDFVFGNQEDITSATQPPAVTQCLSWEGIPRRYRICCGWSKDGECKDIWKEYLQEKEANNLLVKNKYGGVAIDG